MVRFNRIIALLLNCAFIFMMLPITAKAEGNVAIVSDDDLVLCETDCLSNICGSQKLSFYKYEDKYYLNLDKVAELARFESQEEAYTITLQQGYRRTLFDYKEEGYCYMSDDSTPNCLIPILRYGDQWLVEGIPMLRYLGANVSLNDNGVLVISAPLITIWDVLYEFTSGAFSDYPDSLDPAIYLLDMTKVYKDGRKAIIRKAWCDMALDLLDRANGEGLGGLFGAHIKSALCEALDVKYRDYSSVTLEAKSIMQYGNLTNQNNDSWNELAASALKNGPVGANAVTDFAKLNYDVFRGFDTDLWSELRHTFAPNSDFKSLKDIAYDSTGKLSNKFLKGEQRLDTVSDVLSYVSLVTTATEETISKSRLDLDSKELLGKVVTADLLNYYRENGNNWAFSWPNIAAYLGAELQSTALTASVETIEATYDSIAEAVLEKGSEAALELLAAGNGGFILLMVNLGWFGFSKIFEPYFSAVSDDLDAIYLSAIARDTLIYGNDYMHEHHFGSMNYDELEYMRNLCALVFRAGTAYGQKFASSLSASWDSKARELASSYDDKENWSVANSMARKLYMATNCSVNPVRDYSEFVDDITDKTVWIEKPAAKPLDSPSVVSNGSTTFAIKEDNSLWAWGNNFHGQIGDGTTEYRSTPVKVLDDVSSVVMGAVSTFAIKLDGSLWAWGANSNGRLGDGSETQRTAPVKILDNVEKVFCDSSWSYPKTYAILNDGTLMGWGYNENGTLGDGTSVNRLSPVSILSDVVSVKSTAFDWNHGFQMHYAICADGSLFGWGKSAYHELPEDFEYNLNYWWHMSLQQHCENIGLSSEQLSDLVCYVLGNGTTHSSTSPVFITDNVRSVDFINHDGWRLSLSESAAFEGVSCYIVKNDNTLWGWGSNEYGILGDDSREDRLTPIRIMNDVDRLVIHETYDSTYYDNVFCIKTDGSLWGWGQSSIANLTESIAVGHVPPETQFFPVQIMDSVVALETNAHQAYAVNRVKDLMAWGFNADWCPIGTLPDGDFLEPVKIFGNVKTIVTEYELFVGGEDACITYIIKDDASLWGWGFTYSSLYEGEVSGLLGDGSIVTRRTPVHIMDGVQQIVHVEPGEGYSVVIANDGSVWQWGNINGKAVLSPIKVFDGVRMP